MRSTGNVLFGTAYCDLRTGRPPCAAEVAVVLVYFLLVFEDHKWWWKSIAIPGSMGIHFFLYSIYYFKTQLMVRTWLATLIYFQTMALVSLSLYRSRSSVPVTDYSSQR
eukprot:gene57468-biopygen66251